MSEAEGDDACGRRNCGEYPSENSEVGDRINDSKRESFDMENGGE